VPAAQKPTQPLGARHTDEIRFVFGAPSAKFDASDKALSDAMTGFWAAFAKSGNPGAGWPRFTAAEEKQVEFGEGGVTVRERFLKPWRDVVEAAQPK
jgi:para-nitrobenzyl esterase